MSDAPSTVSSPSKEESPTPAPRPRQSPNWWQKRRLGALLLQLRALIALILIVIIFAFLSPSFLTSSDIVILISHAAIYAILAIGMTFTILTGGIDLSVGSIVGLVGMIAGSLIAQGLVLPMFGVIVYFNVWVVVIIGLVIGALIGLVNGLV